eukprot:Rhum_TRINITY_DN13714_c0_g2::Rhum_TRINITY_DN13714_c0_g2_i1::g.63300::m.63300
MCGWGEVCLAQEALGECVYGSPVVLLFGRQLGLLRKSRADGGEVFHYAGELHHSHAGFDGNRVEARLMLQLIPEAVEDPQKVPDPSSNVAPHLAVHNRQPPLLQPPQRPVQRRVLAALNVQLQQRRVVRRLRVALPRVVEDLGESGDRHAEDAFDPVWVRQVTVVLHVLLGPRRRLAVRPVAHHLPVTHVVLGHRNRARIVPRPADQRLLQEDKRRQIRVEAQRQPQQRHVRGRRLHRHHLPALRGRAERPPADAGADVDGHVLVARRREALAPASVRRRACRGGGGEVEGACGGGAVPRADAQELGGGKVTDVSVWLVDCKGEAFDGARNGVPKMQVAQRLQLVLAAGGFGGRQRPLPVRTAAGGGGGRGGQGSGGGRGGIVRCWGSCCQGSQQKQMKKGHCSEAQWRGRVGRH